MNQNSKPSLRGLYGGPPNTLIPQKESKVSKVISSAGFRLFITMGGAIGIIEYHKPGTVSALVHTTLVKVLSL